MLSALGMCLIADVPDRLMLSLGSQSHNYGSVCVLVHHWQASLIVCALAYAAGSVKKSSKFLQTDCPLFNNLNGNQGINTCFGIESGKAEIVH